MKDFGNALIQYALIIALVSVGVGFSFFSLGNLLVTNLTSFKDMLAAGNKASHQSVNVQNKTNNEQHPNNPINADIIQSSSLVTPETICSSGNCAIQFGNYTLVGIPENFNEFVETAGASGGTEKLATMTLQLADQLDAEGKTLEADQIRTLANLEHSLATFQNIVEKELSSCAKSDTAVNCWNNIYSKPISDFTTDPNLLDPYNPDRSLNTVLTHIELGEVNNSGINQIQEQSDNHMIAGMLIESYYTIQNNQNLDPSVKATVQELTYNIAIMAENFQNQMEIIEDPTASSNYTDFLTGEAVIQDATDHPPDMEFFNAYNASKVTNLNAALTCAAGNYDDIKNKCH